MKKYLIIFLGLFLVFGSISVFAGENDVSQTMTISSDEAALLSNVSDEDLDNVEGNLVGMVDSDLTTGLTPGESDGKYDPKEEILTPAEEEGQAYYPTENTEGTPCISTTYSINSGNY